MKASKENAVKAKEHIKAIRGILAAYGAPMHETVGTIAEKASPPTAGDRVAFLEEFLQKCEKKLPSDESYEKESKRHKKGKKK